MTGNCCELPEDGLSDLRPINQTGLVNSSDNPERFPDASAGNRSG